ncbi:probable purine permease 11 isoform X2 [Ananas comosus]|uniref:Probable purine permease n=1 Tax=Ananas comosus TaxID=4615 RepID=A0A6P5FIY3_ANACO|nr:probable purine permease 11 isoform X2 [Ananas comosus]
MGNWKLFMKSVTNTKLKRPNASIPAHVEDADAEELRHPLTSTAAMGDTTMEEEEEEEEEEEKGRRRRRWRWRWWVAVAMHSVLVLSGQSAATLLGRFYYDHGGSSMWLQTLTLSAAFPVLFLPRLLLFTPQSPPLPPPSPLLKLGLAYVGLGLITAVDSLLYSYGLLYLTVSAYSLVCATQLGFNAVFSYFINGEKFTDLTLNSLVLLTFSAAILAVRSDDDPTAGRHYGLGFVLTLAASALYSLILSLMELTFEKLVRSRSLRAVLDMQIYTAAVSTAAAAAGLFISGEYRGLRREAEGFGRGEVGYVMTLIWASVGWQVTNVGLVGLISEVSALFSNVISTLGIPIAPVFAVILFKDKMDGVKVISLLLAIWGFISYFYQHYLDYKAQKKATVLGERGDARDASA